MYVILKEVLKDYFLDTKWKFLMLREQFHNPEVKLELFQYSFSK
jgi:hypothetical protein